MAWEEDFAVQVLEAALDARGAEAGRRNLRGMVVSAASQQRDKKEEGSHSVKGHA